MRAYEYVWNWQEHHWHHELGEVDPWVNRGLVSSFRFSLRYDGKCGDGLVDDGRRCWLWVRRQRKLSLSWSKHDWLWRPDLERQGDWMQGQIGARVGDPGSERGSSGSSTRKGLGVHLLSSEC